MAGNTDVYSALKCKVEKLPANVVVIGSHTQMDNRKEKVSNLLFFGLFLFLSFMLYDVCLTVWCWKLCTSAVSSWWPFVHKVWSQPDCFT